MNIKFDIACTRFLENIDIEVLAQKISNVYERAIEFYDREFGFDENVFGLAIYRAINRQMEYLAEELDVRTVSRNGDIRIVIMPEAIEFAFRKVSSNQSAVDSIERSFPGKAGASIGFLKPYKPQQLTLPLNLDFNDSIESSFIVAHNGTPESGLNGIFICQPEKVINDKIVSWKDTKEIYHNNAISSAYASLNIDDDLKPVEVGNPILSEEIIEDLNIYLK